MMDKKEAVRILDDELFSIYRSLEKACSLMNELTDNYFLRYHDNDEKGRVSIVLDWRRRGLYADIVEDYIYQAKNDMESLKGEAEGCLN